MVLPENMEGLHGGAGVGGAAPAGEPPALCALVTGATGGIGRELCAQLARECGTLALVGRDRGKLEELAKDLAERFDVDTHVFVVDFARAPSMRWRRRCRRRTCRWRRS